MQPEADLPPGLPRPGPDALRHSARTAQALSEHIREQGGRITFGDFMHQALYRPGFGYYAAGNAKFGAAGDFVTAPELSPLFGRVVARQCAEVLGELPGGCVLELGAGTGALAATVLEALAELGSLPARYLILEVSADLEARQRERLAPLAETLPVSIEWVAALPEAATGVILANEVADALPVERFQRCDEGLLQQYVVCDAAGGFSGRWEPASDVLTAAVLEIERDIGARLAPGYCSEVSLGLGDWTAQLGGALAAGVAFVFDYGLTRREYYAPDRRSGWLRCHVRHHVHDSPFVYPGVQDLSAWVDFSLLARAAEASGLEVGGFVTQAVFLTNGGLDNEFAGFDQRSPSARFELAEQAKRLLMPTEMGENFKCIALRRAGGPEPSAFASMDRVSSL